ncbi:MAG: hypothetical protein N4A71_05805 [Carboxylicivirga sp.]|jgi:hypothetical protein|nr:hypothetical protein [Carboxylicivirga sp.]
MAAKYYRFIDVLAEWFMQLFFDPAYHAINKNDDAESNNTSKLATGLQQVKKASVGVFRRLKAKKNKGIKFQKPAINLAFHELINFVALLFRQRLWLQVQYLH